MAAAPANALSLTRGRVITGEHTLIVAPANAVVTRGTGWVDGKLRRSFDGPGTRPFFVGSANGYAPLSANVTAGSFPAQLTVRSVEGPAPGIFPVSQALARHWQLAASGISSADLSFTYLDPADLPPTLDEAELRVWRFDGSPYANLDGTVNAAANTVSVDGIGSFGLFTLADASITAPPRADASLLLFVPLQVTAGGTATYSVQIGNQNGPDGLASASVSVDLDPSLSCSWTCTASGGGSCTASGTGAIADTVALPLGALLEYGISCAVSPAASGSLAVSAGVAPTAPATDPNPSNNSTSVSTPVLRRTELGVSLAGNSDPVAAGGALQYTINVASGGPSLAEQARLTVGFAAGLHCTWACTQRTCPGAGSGNVDLLLTLDPGQDVDLVADCAVPANAQGVLLTTAAIAVGIGATDPDPGNNLADLETQVVADADLELLVLSQRRFVRLGETVVIGIVVANNGPAASAAQVEVPLPPGLDLASWTCTGIGGGSCGSASGSGSIAIPVSLPSGGSTLLSLQARVVAADANGRVIVDAAVTGDPAINDPQPGNNADQWNVAVVLFRNGFESFIQGSDCPVESDCPG